MSTDTPHRQLKERQRQERAQLILEVAEEVLAEKGYHDTYMDEIASRAGMAKGTLYQHFPGKEDLVFALFKHGLALFEDAVEQTAASSTPAQAKLQHLLHSIYLKQHNQRTQLLQLLYHNRDIRNVLMEKKGQLHEHLERITGQIRTILEEGKAEGTFDQTIATGLMLTTFMSLIAFSKREELIAQEQLSPEELVAQVGRVFFGGISRKA